MTVASAHTLTADEVATLRHDLRTPVNHIVGYCELLLEDADGPEHAERRDRLQGALRAVRQALEMINTSLAPGERDVTQHDVDTLYERLREPHARIMASVGALLAPSEQDDSGEFAADVRKIRHATEQLVAVSRTQAVEHVDDARDVSTEAVALSGGRGAILVVDDEINNRSVLERHLKRQGYDVTCAGDGAAALDLVHRDSYDVVLLDVRMPGMDGREVLRRIKGDPATRDIPVVMISAADDLSTIAACIEAGADDFLPKPFEQVILRARVSACIEKKRLRNLEIDYLHQVERVAEAAAAVERGTYQAGALAQVAERGDALGGLARVFDSMAAGVKAREQRLHDHVATLRREMDEARRSASAASDTQEADDGALIPGELFANRYQIVRVVGRGGMGMVYKARDRELAEDVAIKMLRSDAMNSDATVVERFKTEIRLARRISHRNVVRTHDLGERDGAYYVTMEYVEGITVRDLIDMRGHLSVPSTLGIAQQLAASLEVAHEQGVIHRDIKPQNLLLDPDGVLKVMDFGIARLAQHTSTLTQAGMVIGTPAYMAPEQLLAEEVDARSDLYAVGVVLYECLTGALPFEGASPIALIAKVLHTVPASPAERDASVPPPLSALVMRLLDKDPSARPGSAKELREMLAELG
ncbi:MAG TPA: protein kinase [Candidatus Elarobacter sp.]|nr:protein kinase [Candidatus Elarobacter sp.]